MRTWFTRDSDPILRQIDGLDIGWGGVQRWATVQMPLLAGTWHLDVACGYGTFLAQLGWRHPHARLIGLNIDYAGPHSVIGELLAKAGVSPLLVQADARKMPFADECLASASCFLGLQDIDIGFGDAGVRDALKEVTRVLRAGGVLTLLDEFTFARLDHLLAGLPLAVILRAERGLDVRWTREVAKRAIDLYAEGWVAQVRVVDRADAERVRVEVRSRMTTEMERQLARHGTYVPFGPVRMVAARKLDG